MAGSDSKIISIIINLSYPLSIWNQQLLEKRTIENELERLLKPILLFCKSSQNLTPPNPWMTVHNKLEVNGYWLNKSYARVLLLKENSEPYLHS